MSPYKKGEISCISQNLNSLLVIEDHKYLQKKWPLIKYILPSTQSEGCLTERKFKNSPITPISSKFVKSAAVFKPLTAKNPVISPSFLVWKFCGKAQFPNSFGRFSRNHAETVPFHKISTPENLVKLRDFCSGWCPKVKDRYLSPAVICQSYYKWICCLIWNNQHPGTYF